MILNADILFVSSLLLGAHFFHIQQTVNNIASRKKEKKNITNEHNIKYLFFSHFYRYNKTHSVTEAEPVTYNDLLTSFSTYI